MWCIQICLLIMQWDVVDTPETQSLTHWTSISSPCHTVIVIDSLNVNCCYVSVEGEAKEKSQKQQQSYRVACPRVHGRHATVAASLPTALQLQLMGTATKTTSKKFLKLGIVRHTHTHTHAQDICVRVWVCASFCVVAIVMKQIWLLLVLVARSTIRCKSVRKGEVVARREGGEEEAAANNCIRVGLKTQRCQRPKQKRKRRKKRKKKQKPTTWKHFAVEPPLPLPLPLRGLHHLWLERETGRDRERERDR